MSNFTNLTAKEVVGLQGLSKFMENHDVLVDLNKDETDICGVEINSFVYGYIQGKRDDRQRRSFYQNNKLQVSSGNDAIEHISEILCKATHEELAIITSMMEEVVKGR